MYSGYVPAPNVARRRALATAAIELIARTGLHGLTHRSVDRAAGVPAGTASNYFPSRDALLTAIAEEILARHQDDMRQQTERARGGRRRRGSLPEVVELIAESLHHAATVERHRYLAMYELQGELRRRPELAATLGDLMARAGRDTIAYHREYELPIPPSAAPALQALYGGALLALLSMPAEAVTPAAAHRLAAAMVYGVRR
jgi:DNA-binding transcriptional regulator YbjK